MDKAAATTPATHAQIRSEPATNTTCPVCDLERIMSRKIGEMCERGKLSNRNVFRVCNWHAQKSMQSVSRHVVDGGRKLS